MKIGIEGAFWTAEYYEATVVSVVDYYPFGSAMAGRKYNQGTYRYGFNGKEEDKEWGSQMIQDYGFRIYNPTIGKFLSVDPLSSSYPWYTPYQFAGNKPICFIDLDGLEEADPDRMSETTMKVPNLSHLTEEQIKANNKKAFEELVVNPIADEIPILGEANAYRQGGIKAMMWGLLPFGRYAQKAFNGLRKMFKRQPKVTSIKPDPVPENNLEVTGTANEQSEIQLYNINTKTVQADKPIADVEVKDKKLCGCFTKNTKVKANNGYIFIGNIIVGDSIWAYNDTTGVWGLKEVTKTIKADWDGFYKISYSSITLEVTHEHPFYTLKGWKNADELSIGDSLFTFHNTWEVISNITFVNQSVTVYNLIVEDFHTYFVSDGDILVHNGNPCVTATRKGNLVETDYGTGTLDGGELSLFIIAPKGKGGETFDAIMSKFQTGEVTSIRGDWRNSKTIGDNFDAFFESYNKYIADGMDDAAAKLKAAGENTFTGHMAKKYGFVPTSVEIQKSRITGKVKAIDVIFEPK